MEIKCTKTFNLSENDIKNIIAMHFKKKGYYVSLNNVKFCMDTRFVDNGMLQYDEMYLKGATVTCMYR